MHCSAPMSLSRCYVSESLPTREHGLQIVRLAFELLSPGGFAHTLRQQLCFSGPAPGITP